ncbi:protein FAM166B [Lingula anatina]|uniref:Protein FAM166B n=1 Tax=Lingula anatina TaxID=7574 RepID=A0A1S3H9L5_LINAN|nr:protein FAM166B [Lingula anatina]|eukprot:XP_013382161.1 protein FAM166B [Lingula anatina]
MPLPAQGKSILQTADPYHIPGYGGYCPQFKYQIGQTFGKTTNRLLQDCNVPSSGRLVLAEIYPSFTETDKLQDMRDHLMKTRTASWGDQKLVQAMVPGYTGFIPKSEHYFGKRYAENCSNAISDFENDQRTYNRKAQELRVIDALQSGKMDPSNVDKLPTLTAHHRTPLRAVAAEAKPYISPNAHHHSMSPYYMDGSNSKKNFMSGYTGFVPRSRGLLGKGYPFITHQALNEFTDGTQLYKLNLHKPVTVERVETYRLDTQPIYPTETGLVPHYTGHIPGEKFRYGRTFGFSTQNALSSTPKQMVTAIA